MSEENEKKFSQKNDERPVTLAELQGFAKGILIEIPSPIVGEFIKVKVKRIDMSKEFLKKPEVTSFLANPVIENYMKTADVNKLKNSQQVQQDLAQQFEEARLNGDDLKSIQELLPLLDEVAKQILIEPTYEDFQNTCGLTQHMKEALFNWAMGETMSLVSFRNGG